MEQHSKYGATGKFTLHEEYSKPATFPSGGIDVTPFMSMIKYATDRNLPIRIIMFDSNKNQQYILFKKDFETCTNTNNNLRIIYTITEEQNKTGGNEWKGEKGRIDMTMLKRHLNSDDIEKSVFYICGPPAMVDAMRNILVQNLQIPAERIKIEEHSLEVFLINFNLILSSKERTGSTSFLLLQASHVHHDV
jgi:ferredoxin-NADP reductase